MASNSVWLAHKLLTLEQQVQALSRGTSLGHSSLHGRSILALDEDGLPVAEFGSEGGSGGVRYLDGPVPPVPSAPVLEQGIGTIFVRWDGMYAAEDVGEPVEAPIDFDRIEVHATTDPELDVWDVDSLAGSITQRDGGVVMIRGWEIDDVVYVRLVCRSLADKVSAASAPAEVTVQGIDIASIVDELDAANVELANLDGTMFAANAELDALRIQFKNLDTSIINTDDGTLAEALADARQALEDAGGRIGRLETSLTELDSTTLPALRQDLDAAEGRLGEAEGQITDAFGQLEVIPGQIDTARQEAIDAAQQELDAVEGTLQSSIDAKRDITWSTSGPPVVYGGPVGSTWFKMSGNGSGAQVESQWRWQGDVWVSTILSSAVLAKIDIGTGTFGTLDGIRLKAESVSAGSLLIGDFTNLVDDPALTGPGWSGDIPYELRYTAQGPGNALYYSGISGGYAQNGNIIPVMPGDKFRITARVQNRRPSPLTAHLHWFQHNMAVSSVSVSDGVDWGTSGLWDDGAATVEAPSDARFGVLRVTFPQNTAQNPAYVIRPVVRRMVGGTLIEPGGIQTPHLAADVLEVGNLKAGAGEIAELVSRKIAAATGQFLELDVGQLTVTGESRLADVVAEQIAADTAQFIELEADSITAREIAANAIGARAIAADAIEAGKIAADAITGREIAANSIKAEEIVGLSITADELAANSISTSKIVAEAVTADKIVANAITTAKLDALAVTADKVAANAITADKIMANAITAAKLDADAINGKTITGATVRTNATGARVELNPTGLSAWNSVGTRTFNVNQATGEVEAVGSVFSGLPGQQRVVLDDSVFRHGLMYEPPIDDNGNSGAAVPATGAGILMGLEQVEANRMRVGVSASSSAAVGSVIGPTSGVRTPKLLLFSGGHAQLRSDVSGGGSPSGALFSAEPDGRARMSSHPGGATITTRPGNHAWMGAVGPGSKTGGKVKVGIATDTGTSFDRHAVDLWDYVTGSSPFRNRLTLGIDGAEISSKDLITLNSSGDLIYQAGRHWANYNTTTGTANVRLTSSGFVGVASSSRRYKIAIEPMDTTITDVVDKLLSIEPKTWIDKSSAERLSDSLTANTFGQDSTDDLQDIEPLTRIPGVIAEELHDAGLEVFVEYNEQGTPESVKYDRLGVAWILAAQKMTQEIEELRNRIEALS